MGDAHAHASSLSLSLSSLSSLSLDTAFAFWHLLCHPPAHPRGPNFYVARKPYFYRRLKARDETNISIDHNAENQKLAQVEFGLSGRTRRPKSLIGSTGARPCGSLCVSLGLCMCLCVWRFFFLWSGTPCPAGTAITPMNSVVVNYRNHRGLLCLTCL